MASLKPSSVFHLTDMLDMALVDHWRCGCGTFRPWSSHKEFQRDPAPLNRLERLSTGWMEFHGRKYGFRHQPVEVLATATLGLLLFAF